MPRSANNTSAADKIASRVPVDLSERAIRSAVIASVNTAQRIKSSHLFSAAGERRVSVVSTEELLEAKSGIVSMIHRRDA
jgi:hypothetical protein